MKIETIVDQTQVLDKDDLVASIIESINLLTDDLVNQENEELKLIKKELDDSKNELRIRKQKIIELVDEYQKLNIVFKIIQKIDVLKKEGVLTGSNRKRIIDILSKIDQKSKNQLRALDDKLSTYSIEAPKVIL